jgi:hypothetical protein
MGRLTPAASPEVQGAALAAIAVTAKCAATSDDEQAVSIATAGPCRADIQLTDVAVHDSKRLSISACCYRNWWTSGSRVRRKGD